MAKRKSTAGSRPKNAKKRPGLKKIPLAERSGKGAAPAKPSSKRTTNPAIESQPAEHGRSKEKAFYIVGIGASAGGLEACTNLLEHLPPNTGMAFVLVQHLAPTKDSILSELLSKATTMPVREVQDGMTAEPDHVYVIPPNTALAVFHGKLRLLPRTEPHTLHMPIDSFFRSLAEDQGQNAVGIVLSGTGSDGSLGIRAIKAEGGIVMAQDERSAKYNGMPKSAFATGAADYVLPPEKIAVELARISRHPVTNLLTAVKSEPLLSAGEDELNKLFMRIRTATGVDFTYYKRATILRRISRRMLLHKIETLTQYVRYLQEHSAEVGVLYQDILINVTSFFREPETFTALKNVVFPAFIENRSFDVPLRVWVPGCSTGEEAYSLAMCFSEFCEERGVSLPIQFFASDIDEAAIEKARQGVYPDNIVQDVSPERLRHFFTRVEPGYQINKAIREQCIFARQNLIKDPPFSKMDLISCRNLMIYFGPLLQKKALPIMHYALNPSGYLMLGRSESIGEYANLFSLVDKISRIYSKKTSSSEPHFERERGHDEEKAEVKKRVEEHAAGGTDIQKEADSIILNRYSPAGLVINEDMDILQFRGNISPYLKPQPGKASLNLMKMAGENLSMELRVLIRQAQGKDIAVRKEGIQVRHNNIVNTINIAVIAFKAHDSQERLFLVIFEDRVAETARDSKTRGKVQTKTKGRSQEDQVAPLQRELAATQQQLKSIVAEHEAATEELKALNEEVQSSNEELQSINEELETSKEELQSTNEELSTLNDELQNRNEEITQSNNDLVNVLSGVDIPILLIGNKLQIRRFNASAGKALNLIATDIGRPISDIRPNIIVPDLDRMILEVIDSLTIREQEIQDTQGRWYSMTIRPYKTVDNRIDGALVTLEDINDLKQSMLRIKEARDYAEAIVETVWEPLIILSKDLRVVTANDAYYKKFGVTPDAIENKSFSELQNGFWNIPGLREQLEDFLEKNSVLNNLEIAYEAAGVDRKILLINARTVISKDPDAHLILLAIEDVTSRRQAEEALRESKEQFHTLADSIPNLAWWANGDGYITWYNRRWYEYTGTTPKQMEGWGWQSVHDPEVLPKVLERWKTSIATGEPFDMEFPLRGADGLFRTFLTRVLPLKDSAGQVLRWFGTNTDISAIKQAEDALRESEEKYRSIIETASEGIWIGDFEGRTTFVNESAAKMIGYSPEELLGKTAYDFMDEEARAIGRLNLERRRQGHKNSYELKFIRKDGSTLWALVGATPLRDKNGNAVASMAMLTDITERKLAEEKTLHQQAVLTSINRIFREALATDSEEELGRTCLSVAEELTNSKFGFIGEIGPDGLIHNTAISDPGWHLCTMKDQTNHHKPLGDFKVHGLYGRVIIDERPFFTNDPYSHHDSIGTPEGHPRLTAFLGVPLIHRGKTIGLIALGNREGGYRSEDVETIEPLATVIVQALMRKRTEASLQTAHAELKQRACELEAVNRELEAFSYTVSHDLKAPLRSIDGFTRALLEDYGDKLDSTARDYLMRVNSAALRMNQLIQAMLDMARLTRRDLYEQSVDLSALAQVIADNLRKQDPARMVEFIIADKIRVRGDTTLLQAVLENLMHNAWKFTGKHKTARIEFGVTAMEGHSVYFVKDNGAGFDMQFADKIFMPFNRLHTESEFTGLGIGLATAYRIILRHNGRLWTESAPEKGATFYFTLPQT